MYNLSIKFGVKFEITKLSQIIVYVIVLAAL